jgi:Tol biopolymer transport system component
VELPRRNAFRSAGWTLDNKIGLLLQNPLQQTIYTVAVTGGKAAQVAPDGAVFPSWSPDGSRIFFQSDSKICSVPAGGGPAREIQISGSADPKGFLNPEISPDGQLIVFPSGKQGESGAHLWTIPVGGGESRQITVSPGTDVFPQWSPDGRSVMFTRQVKVGNSYKTSFYVTDLAGGSPRELSFFQHGSVSLTWSPDGQSVTCASGGQIKRVSFDGEKTSVLAELQAGQREVRRMAWTRDGRKLAYSTKEGIFILDLANGKIEKIATGLDAEPGSLSWSPDGERIAFAAAKGGDYELWLMEDFLRLLEKLNR